MRKDDDRVDSAGMESDLAATPRREYRVGGEPNIGRKAFRASANPEYPVMTENVIILQPIVALIAGILILIVPRILNYIVAIYLILIGLIGLWPRLLA